jgi:hypothetical protein
MRKAETNMFDKVCSAPAYAALMSFFLPPIQHSSVSWQTGIGPVN